MIGDEIELQGRFFNRFGRPTGGVFLQPGTISQAIDVGGPGNTVALDISNTELDALAPVGFVTIGRSDGTGGITLNSIVASSSLTVQTKTGTISVPNGQTVSMEGNWLTLIGDEIDMIGNARIDGTGEIRLHPSEANRPVEIGGSGGTAALDITASELDSLSNGFSSIVIGDPRASADQMSTPVTIISGNFVDPVSIRGSINLTGNITGLDNASVTLEGTNISLAGNITTSGNPVVFNGPVTVNGATISNGAGDITFNKVVNGPGQLSVFSTGTTTFASAMGNTSPLSSFSTDAGGVTRVVGGVIRTAGVQGQRYGDTTVIVGDTVFEAGAGDIRFGGRSSLNSPDSSTFIGAPNVSFMGTGIIGIGGPIGNTSPIATVTMNAGNAGGSVVLTDSAMVRTFSAQTYNSPVTLETNTVMESGNGNIAFENTVNGGFSLTVNSSGITTFKGPVGGLAPVAAITTDAAGSTAIAGGAVTTTGAQIYNDTVALIAGTTFSAINAPITFANGLNGAHSLTVTSGTGNIALGAVTGAIAPPTSLNGTGGNIALDSIIINGPVTLTATTGAITDNLNGASSTPVANITAPSATLTAATGIGRLIGGEADAVVTSVQNLTASSTTGPIFVHQIGPVTLGAVTAHAGPVAIENTGGNLTLGGNVTSITDAVFLLANDASILASNGVPTHVTADADSGLFAAGVVGVVLNPVRVNIRGGNLGVIALDHITGVSGVINGTVLPGNALTVLAVPPGAILFNGVPATIPIASPHTGIFTGPEATTALSYLNPNAVVTGSAAGGGVTSYVHGPITTNAMTRSDLGISGGAESVAGFSTAGEISTEQAEDKK